MDITSLMGGGAWEHYVHEDAEPETKQVSPSQFPYDRLLMAGEYSTWDLYDQYDEEAWGVLPPIGYEEGWAL